MSLGESVDVFASSARRTLSLDTGALEKRSTPALWIIAASGLDVAAQCRKTSVRS